MARGTDSVYESTLSYGDAVTFFDETLSKNGCETAQRATTSAATIWSMRCPDGLHGHVAVRSTHPTTVEVVTAYVRQEGVTNAQPTSRWPYDGAVIRLGP